MVFHWSFSYNKSPHVSRTLLSILTDLNNAVVWMVSARPLISKSSRPFINPLVTVSGAPITNGITVTFTFHCLFVFPALWQGVGTYLSFFFFFFFFSFTPWSAGRLSVFISRSGRLAEIR